MDERIRSTLKILLHTANLPILNIFDEILFEYGGRVKQNRLNQFSELLINYFEQRTNISIEDLKTERFVDLFDSVIRKVVRTSSPEKLQLFKEILTDQIENPLKEVDKQIIFIDLIDQLSNNEFYFFKKLVEFTREYRDTSILNKQSMDQLQELENLVQKEHAHKEMGHANSFDTNSRKLEELKTTIEQCKIKLDNFSDTYLCESLGISKEELLFYKQSLINKGLMMDSGIGYFDYKPYELMDITELGRQFLDYINKIK